MLASERLIGLGRVVLALHVEPNRSSVPLRKWLLRGEDCGLLLGRAPNTETGPADEKHHFELNFIFNCRHCLGSERNGAAPASQGVTSREIAGWALDGEISLSAVLPVSAIWKEMSSGYLSLGFLLSKQRTYLTNLSFCFPWKVRKWGTASWGAI